MKFCAEFYKSLIRLIGSKPAETKQVSLDETIKEFNYMVSHTDHHDDHQVAEPIVAQVPTWAKILEPVVGLIVLGYLYCAYQHLVG
jgi:predicted membrane-bound mannosyltransferase